MFPNQIRIKNLNNKNNLEIYEGEVNIDNLKHGFGILTTPQYEMRGSWRKDEFTGWGRKLMRNGEIMEAKFVNGKLNGKGYYKNLTCFYEGEFFDSKKCGKGILKTQKYIYTNLQSKNLTFLLMMKILQANQRSLILLLSANLKNK